MIATDSTSGSKPDLERLQLDYDQVHQMFRLLTDIRSRLLSLLPSVSAVVIALLSSSSFGGPADTMTRTFLGLLGFVVALGIVIYDLRNSQIYAAVIHRGKFLEVALNLPPNDQRIEVSSATKLGTAADKWPGGIFMHRTSGTGSFFGVPIKHDWGTGLIYSAVLAAWAFTAVSGLLAPYLSVAVSLAIGGVSLMLLRAGDRSGDFVRDLGYPPIGKKLSVSKPEML